MLGDYRGWKCTYFLNLAGKAWKQVHFTVWKAYLLTYFFLLQRSIQLRELDGYLSFIHRLKLNLSIINLRSCCWSKYVIRSSLFHRSIVPRFLFINRVCFCRQSCLHSYTMSQPIKMLFLLKHFEGFTVSNFEDIFIRVYISIVHIITVNCITTDRCVFSFIPSFDNAT